MHITIFNWRSCQRTTIKKVQRENVKVTRIFIVTGDCNSCCLDAPMGFHLQIIYLTQLNKMINMFYCNVRNVYKFLTLPTLDSSNHNMTNVLPINCRQLGNSNQPRNHCTSRPNGTSGTKISIQWMNKWNILLPMLAFVKGTVCHKKKTVLYSNNKQWVIEKILKFVFTNRNKSGR